MKSVTNNIYQDPFYYLFKGAKIQSPYDWRVDFQITETCGLHVYRKCRLGFIVNHEIS